MCSVAAEWLCEHAGCASAALWVEPRSEHAVCRAHRIKKKKHKRISTYAAFAARKRDFGILDTVQLWSALKTLQYRVCDVLLALYLIKESGVEFPLRIAHNDDMATISDDELAPYRLLWLAHACRGFDCAEVPDDTSDWMLSCGINTDLSQDISETVLTSLLEGEQLVDLRGAMVPLYAASCVLDESSDPTVGRLLLDGKPSDDIHTLMMETLPQIPDVDACATGLFCSVDTYMYLYDTEHGPGAFERALLCDDAPQGWQTEARQLHGRLFIDAAAPTPLVAAGRCLILRSSVPGGARRVLIRRL